MGTWLTHEERLEYHRKYNAKYRQEHPEKIKQYQMKSHLKCKKKVIKKLSDVLESYRKTDIVDTYDEGDLI